MTRSSAQTKVRILTAAYQLFYREGFSRVSVDAIAEASGVTKRTLYYHFDSKDSLVAAVLNHQHMHAMAQIRDWGPRSAQTRDEFLATLFKQFELWASRPKWLGSGFTRLTMELADLPGHPARHAARQHKAIVEDWLAEEMKRLEAPHPEDLARQLMLLIEGCVSLILIHGDTSYAIAAARAASKLVDGEQA